MNTASRIFNEEYFEEIKFKDVMNNRPKSFFDSEFGKKQVFRFLSIKMKEIYLGGITLTFKNYYIFYM